MIAPKGMAIRSHWSLCIIFLSRPDCLFSWFVLWDLLGGIFRYVGYLVWEICCFRRVVITYLMYFWTFDYFLFHLLSTDSLSTADRAAELAPHSLQSSHHCPWLIHQHDSQRIANARPRPRNWRSSATKLQAVLSFLACPARSNGRRVKPLAKT